MSMTAAFYLLTGICLLASLIFSDRRYGWAVSYTHLGIKHQSPEFIDEAVYGLCEINREDIKKARLIANPGCYPTCSTLSIYQMAKEGLIEMNSVIIDAKSGRCV